MDSFAQALLAWYHQHGRHNLPWQQDITPYRVWVSEIMLQQTQVATVIDYFNRFMQRFPTVNQLAAAELDEVLHLWTGLGYYARARNLHKTAQTVVDTFGGEFPTTQQDLEALPGIGRSTAGAIRAISQGQVASILDGNVKRVLTRLHSVEGFPGQTQVSKKLWQIAEQHTPAIQTNHYTQAIMDLGATICTRKNPDCNACPVATLCSSNQHGTVDQFPHPKPKKEKPTRHARFFVLSQPSGATLLEQMPLNGLWGGLWTPPQRPADMDPSSFLQEPGLNQEDSSTTHTAPQFRHIFTHYHLMIEPIYITLKEHTLQINDDQQQRWYHPNEQTGGNAPIGLSVPAVKLLASLNQSFTLEPQ